MTFRIISSVKSESIRTPVRGYYYRRIFFNVSLFLTLEKCVLQRSRKDKPLH